ncbi:MAG: hypothetical protein R3C20_06595 [Planctomycetaceae bacterium]
MNHALNLLPFDVRQKHLLRVLTTRWLRVGVVLLVTCAGLITLRENDYRKLARRNAANAASAMAVRTLVQNVSESGARVNALTNDLNHYHHSQPTPDPLRWIRAVHFASSKTDASLVVVSMRITHSRQCLPSETSRICTAAVSGESFLQAHTQSCLDDPGWIRSTVELIGHADTDISTTQFVSALRDSGVFDLVQLRSTAPVTEDSAFQREFVVECTRRERSS